MVELYDYVSPFIAAFGASYLTYRFAVRAKRHEALTSHRLIAFKEIQKQLASFKRYYGAHLAEMFGNEFAPRPSDLKSEDNNAPLQQRELIQNVLDENLVFLSAASRKLFEELDAQLNFLCHVELLHATEPEEWKENRQESYEKILDSIEKCVDGMYRDLKLPS